MPSGEYGVICATCKAFIRINSYTDYRPQFLQPAGASKACAAPLAET
jgi:hypothetical protein